MPNSAEMRDRARSDGVSGCQLDDSRPTPLKLNLGCGFDLRAGYVNVDDGSMWMGELPPGTLVCNLNHPPWPFQDKCADEVLMWHTLEHLQDTGSTMREVRRILKDGGRFWGQVPFGPCHDSITHWQHYRYFSSQCLERMAESFGFRVNSITSNSKGIKNIVPAGLRKILARVGWTEAFDTISFDMTKQTIR